MAIQVEQLITGHLDLWTQAQTAKSASGRGSNNKIELTGIKKLRELILELAVRGKLVPQDPNDEPASELLKRIAAEKEMLVNAGKLKKQKPLPPITDAEKPFELPGGWEWCRISDVSMFTTSGSRDWAQYYSESGAIFVTMGNLSKGSYDLRLDNLRYVLPPKDGEGSRTKLEAWDLLISITGDVGNLGLIPENFGEAYINQHTCLLRFMPSCRNRFFPELLRSPFSKIQFDAPQRGIKNSFRLSDVGEMLCPIPPSQEQLKIVAKIDELMAFCDQLEQQSYKQLDAHNQLVDALLATLTQSQNADDLASSWQRLAAHFDTLFTTEYSIDALKKTILQLAVMGKLVKQDLNDEPASELLKRIALEKDALVKAGKIKKQKPLPPIGDDEKPFELPQGWEWCRLEQLGLTSTGKTPSTSNSEFFGGEVPFIGPGQINQMGEILTSDKFLTEKGVIESTEGMPGDILTVCIGGSIGKSAITKNRITFNQQINAIRPIHVDISYLYYE
ncbi:restriction endonuclease subunit S, partial [Rheinheimera baltica]